MRAPFGPNWRDSSYLAASRPIWALLAPRRSRCWAPESALRSAATDWVPLGGLWPEKCDLGAPKLSARCAQRLGWAASRLLVQPPVGRRSLASWLAGVQPRDLCSGRSHLAGAHFWRKCGAPLRQTCRLEGRVWAPVWAPFCPSEVGSKRSNTPAAPLALVCGQLFGQFLSWPPKSCKEKPREELEARRKWPGRKFANSAARPLARSQTRNLPPTMRIKPHQLGLCTTGSGAAAHIEAGLRLPARLGGG